MLDKAMPFWTLPTKMIEEMINEIYELIVVINYIPEWELTSKDCRRITLILKEMQTALEHQCDTGNRLTERRVIDPRSTPEIESASNSTLCDNLQQ